MRKGKRTRMAGFTLIELLTVVAIIAVLAAILLPTLVGVRQRARRVEAQNMIRALELAVERFKLDHSQYPWAPPPQTPEKPVSADVIRELMADDPRITAGSVPTYNRTGRSYLTGVKDEYIKDGTLVDPWGEEYRFQWESASEKVLIYSFGGDGDDGGGEGDITNQ